MTIPKISIFFILTNTLNNKHFKQINFKNNYPEDINIFLSTKYLEGGQQLVPGTRRPVLPCFCPAQYLVNVTGGDFSFFFVVLE